MKSLFPQYDHVASLDQDALRSDVIAGLTTAVMLVPQAMAYAMLAGLEPIVGLYASMAPLLVYGLFGTSRQLAVGPVAMVSLLVASAVAPLAAAGSPEYLGLAVALAVLVGVIQLAMGVFRLGVLVRLLSHPVVAGFTSAAALIIGTSQLTHVVGVKIPRSHHVHETALHALSALPQWHWPTVAVAVAAVAGLVALQRSMPRFPRHLAVVAGGGLIMALVGVEGVAVIGQVPAGLPMPSLPSLDLQTARTLLPMAMTISLVGFMESIAVARTFARRHQYPLDPDQELRALGAANLAGALFGAYPVTGGFSRTAVNAQAGARSGLASIVTALTVLAVVAWFTPMLSVVPKAVLAAIILTAVLGLVDIDEARHLWQTNKVHFVEMAVTFAATLTVGIEQGIVIGVVTALVLDAVTPFTPATVAEVEAK